MFPSFTLTPQPIKRILYFLPCSLIHSIYLINEKLTLLLSFKTYHVQYPLVPYSTISYFHSHILCSHNTCQVSSKNAFWKIGSDFE